jgi:hypothetical protein
VNSLTTTKETHVVTSEPGDGDMWTSANPAIEYPRGDGRWSAEPWVFVDGEEYLPAYWDWGWTNGNIYVDFIPDLEEGQTYTILYKKWKKGVVEHESTISGNGWSYGMSTEPAVPYVFGEWCFDLTYDREKHSTHQFRCVSQIGMTDINDAYDADMDAVPDHPADDIIDMEICFQYDEVFNPFDLWEASHKANFRWAQKGEIDWELSESQYVGLMSHLSTHPVDAPAWCLDHEHLIFTDTWPSYKDWTWGPLGRAGIRVLLLDLDGVLDPVLADGPWVSSPQWFWDNGGIALVLDEIDEDYDAYKILYTTWLEFEPPMSDVCWASGRWEWIVVGRDSAAVDSAGAAMISAAWQEWKHKEVWLSGLDMKETEYGPTVPWVMAIMDGDGSEKTDYKYNYTGGDYRMAFRDDWCTPWDWDGEEIYPYAISSSNIIVVGGPFANQAAMYFNDFTDAMIGTGYGEGFYAPGCWARTSQPSINQPRSTVHDDLWYDSTTIDDTIGHAIVSTYLDLNGTVGFIVYGWTGEDTYYASYAIRGGLLYWLQELQDGVTTLVLEFEYDVGDGTGPHPVVTHIAESLGTITECTGLGTNFKDAEWEDRLMGKSMDIEMRASDYGLCYKLVPIDWCSEVHPDP